MQQPETTLEFLQYVSTQRVEILPLQEEEEEEEERLRCYNFFFYNKRHLSLYLKVLRFYLKELRVEILPLKEEEEEERLR